MHDFLIGAAASAVTGVLLWLFLPRGAVLTKEVLTHNPSTGEQIFDTWRVTNTSPVPVRLVSIEYYGAGTVEHPDGPWLPFPEFPEGEEAERMHLRLDDEVLEMARLDARKSWSGVVIPPGDTMTAKVPLLTDVRVRYRRAGWTGASERRWVKIRGGS